MKRILAHYLVTICFAVIHQTHAQHKSLVSVKIGTQEWLAENLNTTQFANGDPIQEVKTAKEWEQANNNHEPAWCYYDNDYANGYKYGKLYNWYAVSDPRGLAPKGWHIPSDEEWIKLVQHLGGLEMAGDALKSTQGWKDNGNGNNKSGMTALSGGSRGSRGGFKNFGCYWWSSTEVNATSARHYGVTTKSACWNFSNKGFGFSVRCVRD